MNKLLIANRGEIACRIIQTARRLKWNTVAVYSSADRQALHVSLADEAYLIGDAAPSESYLNQQRILAVASEAGVTAIHPGYGFLSENPEFAQNCERSDIVFVGPPTDAIKLMGLKGAAKQQMQAAGVPVLPGINQVTANTPIDEIVAIGLPVLIKPEAGGGGKGMKIVEKAQDLAAALISARREALAAFGSDGLMVEKYLLQPRHIEIQVFADQAGNCIHLHERDCSLQRRHQKIIEEAPAPDFNDDLRQAMGQAAIAAARAVNYVGAGTVEFLLTADGQFFFMEMNTRLQVEHPVTEKITGIDLVEWQLKIAMGEPLPLQQHEIKTSGHAIEVRIYAEDPSNEFLPVSGRITHLDVPAQSEKLRIDTGIQSNDLIGVYYDPLLMKMIAWEEDRPRCIEQMKAAISSLKIAGIRTNRDFLLQLISHAPFQRGGLGTDYLDHQLPRVLSAATTTEVHRAICAAAIYLVKKDSSSPWNSLTGFRLNSPCISQLSLILESETINISIESKNDLYIISIANQSYPCRVVIDDRRVTLFVNQSSYVFDIHQQGDTITLFSPTRTFELGLPNVQAEEAEEEGNLQAPMAGRIISITVTEGERVTKGAQLAVIEAMKMEHSLNAPDDGKIVKVYFRESDLVDEGVALFEFETKTA